MLSHRRTLGGDRFEPGFDEPGRDIDLGLDVDRRRPVMLTPHDLAHHVLLCGMTGTGKSMELLNIARQIVLSRALSQSAGGMLLIDPHWDIAPRLLSMMTVFNTRVPLLVIEPDGQHVVAFDPLQSGGADAHGTIVRSIAHGWNRSGHDDAPLMEQGLRLVLSAIQSASGTLADAHLLLSPDRNRSRRQNYVNRIVDAELRERWREIVSLSPNAFLFRFGSTQRAFERLLGDEQDRLIYGQGATWRFEQAIDEGWIILAGGGRSDGSLQRLTLQLDAFWSALFHRRQKYPPFHLLIDEATEVLTPAMLPLLPQGRKRGLRAVLALQSPRQLSGSTTGRAMFTELSLSTRSKIVFALDPSGSREMAGHVGGDIRQLQSLRDRHAVVRTISDPTPRTIVTDDLITFGARPHERHAYLERRLSPFLNRFVFTSEEAVRRYRDRLQDCDAATVASAEPDEFDVVLPA